jgi:hypothetical protein
MGKTKKEKERKMNHVPEDNELDNLDSFIEKRMIQNKALKKLIPENEKKQKGNKPS